MKKIRILLLAGVLLLALASPSLADTLFSYAATDLPKPLPDMQTTYDTINVTAHGTITDLNVFLNLDHNYVGDFTISIAHGATSVWLMSHDGDSGDNVRNVSFDDSANTSISDGIPPYDLGPFKPTTHKTHNNLLSAFNGQDVYGAWTLNYQDLALGDSGTLDNFGVEGTLVPLPPAILLLGSGLLGLIGIRRFSS